MSTAEVVGLWVAVAAYAAAFVLAVFGLVLSRPAALGAAFGATAAGWFAQGSALAFRGVAEWSPPFNTYYESVLCGTWLATGALLVLARRSGGLRPALAILNPVSLLLLGSAMFTDRSLRALIPGLQSWWLVVHVCFALLAFGCMAVAAATGPLLWFPRAARAPAPAVLDRLLFRAFALAFIFQIVMIASGSIWANQAWGRWWGWDPIETFSLLTLIAFGIALHLKIQFGWSGPRLAWLAVAGFLLTVYGIWGVPFFQQSVHLYQGPRGSGGG